MKSFSEPFLNIRHALRPAKTRGAEKCFPSVSAIAQDEKTLHSTLVLYRVWLGRPSDQRVNGVISEIRLIDFKELKELFQVAVS
jgi:hypothetical protein